jgi:hypothetical protein
MHHPSRTINQRKFNVEDDDINFHSVSSSFCLRTPSSRHAAISYFIHAVRATAPSDTSLHLPPQKRSSLCTIITKKKMLVAKRAI